MELDLLLLARHAEAQGDLINMLGGGWDSVTVTETPEGLPDGAVAMVSGVLVARVRFHQVTETGRDHSFSVTLVDEDGAELGKLGGGFPLARAEGLPVGWQQNMNIVLPFNIPVPHYGAYTFSLEVDGRHLGDRAFRVIDAREGEQGMDADAA